jgi:peptide/nickel transport system permease protein
VRSAVARTQGQLIWRRFARSVLARIGLVVLVILYGTCVFFAEFFAPYGPERKFASVDYPPQKIHFVDERGRFHLVPFVYRESAKRDPSTWQMVFAEDKSRSYRLRLFVHGDPYELFGLLRSDLHFFGVEGGGFALILGSDELGRDMLSRIIYAMRVSLTIGFVGVLISLVLGLAIGGMAGLIGGSVDQVVQKIIEVLISIPKLPLWMAFAAAVPKNWTALQVYFAITIILSLVGWPSLARVISSKFKSLKSEDYVTAAVSFNAGSRQIVVMHLIPNFLSFIIVNITMAIPGMILGETSLSFLGVGLRPPVISLGVLLQQSQNLQTIILKPWLLLPGLFVVIVVLAFNVVGDGLRDAADPHK